jgi:chromosome segregation ATPase
LPRPTNTELIQELTKDVTLLKERLENARQQIESTSATLTNVQNALSTLEKDCIHLRRDADEIKKWKDDLKKEQDERTRRRWSFGPNIAGAIVNVILATIASLIVAYFATKH